MTSFPS